MDQERDLARRRERKQYGEEGGEAEPEDEAVAKDTVAPELPAGLPPRPPVKIPTGPLADIPIVVHKRGTAAVNQDVLDRVRKATMTINNRLNKSGELRSGVPIDNKGPDAGAFHATLEINDYPRMSCPSLHLTCLLRFFADLAIHASIRESEVGRYKPH